MLGCPLAVRGAGLQPPIRCKSCASVNDRLMVRQQELLLRGTEKRTVCDWSADEAKDKALQRISSHSNPRQSSSARSSSMSHQHHHA